MYALPGSHRFEAFPSMAYVEKHKLQVTAKMSLLGTRASGLPLLPLSVPLQQDVKAYAVVPAFNLVHGLPYASKEPDEIQPHLP